MTVVSESAKGALKEQLFKNFSFGFAARIYYLGTRFLLTPITLAYVTLDEYGIWAACFILISYMGMSSMGISNVYIRYVAQFAAKGEQDKINKLVSTGLLVTGTIGTLVLAILIACLPACIHLLKIQPALTHVATVLILATAITFMVDLTFGVFNDILTGMQQIALNNLIWSVTVTVEVAVTVVMLRRGYGIYSLAWAFGTRYLVATILKIWYCYRAMPGLSIGLRHFDRANLRLFFGYGSIVQGTALLCTFLYSIEKVIAGIFVGVQATALFDVGEKLPVMGSQLSGSMNSIFMPALSHMSTLTWKDELVKLYLKGTRYMNIMTGAMMGFMAAFAYPLLHLWIGHADKFAPAVPILMIFCIPYQINSLTGPGSAYHRAVGHPVRELTYPVMQFAFVVLFVGLGFLLVGKTTVVIAVAVASAMVLSGLIYIAYSNHVMGVPQVAFLTQSLIPGLVPYCFGFAVSWACSPLVAWAGVSRIKLACAIMTAGAIYLTLVAAVLYRAFCPWGEREYLRKQVLHSFGTMLGRQGA
jgi:O-antigen/teichoic acid export membrane protein